MSHFLNSKDLGSITAYGDALTGGYEGSKETFYSYILNQGEFTLPINPSIKPDECTMYIDNVQGDREDVTIPTYASGKIVYDGESHTVVFDDVDNELMDVGGTFTATNAGTYYAEFTLKDTSTYQWADGGIWKQRLPWTIEKMAGVLNLSDNIVVVNDEETTQTITFTASNTVTVEVQDATIATATISGNSIIVTMVSGATGVTKLTVTCAESENQKGVVKELAVYANRAPIFGVEWSGDSKTWDRIGASLLFDEPIAAVNNGDGYSPYDKIYPWSQMMRVTDEDGGEMVSIPKFYYALTNADGKIRIQISKYEFAGSHISPAHRNRGDDKGERDVVYVGRYIGTKSYSGGSARGKLSRYNARTSISNYGSTIWQWDYSMYITICMLYLVEYASWETADTIGVGWNGSSLTPGATDSMVYHTGTVGASRDTHHHTQYRYIEDLWAYTQTWVDGIRISGLNVYIIDNPRDFSETANGIRTSSRCGSSGYITGWNIPSEAGYEWAIIPSTVSSSAGSCGQNRYNYYGTGSSANSYMVGGCVPNAGKGLFDSSVYYGNYTFKGFCRNMKLP